MAQFGGVVPDNIDLSQFAGIPEYLTNKQARLSDHNPERDKKLVVRFYQDSYFMGALTRERGYPVFEVKDFISVIADDKSDFHQQIKFDEKGNPYPNIAKWLTRFPRHWEAYKQGKTQGYPLDKVPNVDLGLVATLAAVKVTTAEHFVQLEGEMFDRIPGLSEMKAQVQKFLDGQDLLIGEQEKRKELEKELAKYKSELAKAKKATNKGA